jgi:hypothetical protein
MTDRIGGTLAMISKFQRHIPIHLERSAGRASPARSRRRRHFVGQCTRDSLEALPP